MALTHTAISKAAPKAKMYKMYDSGGLFLLVSPSGGKWWRMKYRVRAEGKAVGRGTSQEAAKPKYKEKLLSLGVFPEISLKEAREKRDEYRKKLAHGVDPGENRKAAINTETAEDSFQVIAVEWLAKQVKVWEEVTYTKVVRMFERDLYPWLGSRRMREITPYELLQVLQRIEKRGAIETAHRASYKFGQVARYAVATARADRDITADLRGALAPVNHGHLAAITDPEQVGNLMRAINDYHGGIITRCALRLAPLVFVRPGELRKAEWAHFNLDKAEWNIPARKMKMKDRGDHLVPLSKQAVAILKEVKPVTGKGRFVFPGVRGDDRPMSENTVLVALRVLGFEKGIMTGHGFRAMARTIMDEEMGIKQDYIEHQLAHAVRDPNGRAYNRTTHLAARREMMQQWADYLDGLANAKS